MTIVAQVLTGMADALGSGLTAVAALTSLTTIHTVPSGETHFMEIQLSNRHASNTIVIKIDVGATTDAIHVSLLPESTQKVGPIALSNTTLKLGAVADETDVGVSGIVWKQS